MFKRAADRQPRRDRGPHHPRLPRAGHRDRRGLLRRRRARAARRGWPIARCASGPPPPRESYLSIAAHHRRGRSDAAPTRSTRATASCPRTPRSRARARTPASIFVGPPAAVDRADGIEDRRAAADAGAPACRSCPARRRTISPTTASLAAVERVGLPGADQGVGRRRRQGHAASCRDAADVARGDPGGAARGGGRVRRRHAVRRAADRAAAPRRDPGLRRRPRPRRAPLRARVLGAAPAPEGHRGEPVAGADAGAARAHGRGRGRRRARRRLPQRRHDRVPARGRRRRGAASTSSR